MSKLLLYETIVKAHEGDPDAIDTVLSCRIAVQAFPLSVLLKLRIEKGFCLWYNLVYHGRALFV